MIETPAQLGYRMPAEWEPHEATWIAWPHNREDWPGKFAPIPWVYTEIVRHLSRVEHVNILVKGGRKRRERVTEMLGQAGTDLGRVTLIGAPTDRVWLRDSGPTFLVHAGETHERLALLNWKFNAWAKYDNYHSDKLIPKLVSQRLHAKRWSPRVELAGEHRRVVLEGGAIDVNGAGSVLTTEECLLSDVQARNPWLDRAGVERVLADFLAAPNVIWLGPGIAGDDTHGHVDDLARFVSPNTVVAVVEERKSDPNYEPLRENWKRLEAARDQEGNALELVPLPMPEPVLFEGERLPASYANFYVANGLVLVPTFNDPADRQALNTLASVFPGRSVVGIHCLDLVLGLGTLHCLTQQQPATT